MSSASWALDSATLWPLQTTQRSSRASRSTRWSRSLACTARLALSRRAAPRLRMLELLDQRQQALLQVLGRHRPGMAQAHDAAAVDDEGFGHAGHAPGQAAAPLRVEQRQRIGVAVAPQEGGALLGRVAVVEADDAHAGLAGELAQHRQFGAAGRAPGREHIEHPDLALRRGRAIAAQALQVERRRRLADQRRRWLGLRIVLQQAAGQQADQGGGQREGKQGAELHGVDKVGTLNGVGSSCCGASAGRRRRAATAHRPPAVIASTPAQTQLMKGLICTRSAQRPSAAASPRLT
mmetsp:Transcript_22389/g.88603  ORF Transcript_22389/g.88603 Transcript_22389/m.88603 type:complete len:293 (-) Transcript_22389:412-1290(-)